MRYFRRSAFLRLVVLPFTLSLWLSACTSYVAMQAPYEQTIVSEEPGTVRVTLEDGSRFNVRHPRIEADSLFGFDAKTWDKREGAYRDSVQVAMQDVFSIEQQKTNVLKGLGTGVLVATAISAVFLLIACSGDDSDLFCP